MTLVVFSDDWGRHPSSCQYLIRELLPHTSVLWVNTIGMRRIKPDWSTVRRGAEKLAQWFGPKPPAASLPANLTVFSPMIWPGFANKLERGFNRRLLKKQLLRRVRDLPQPLISITTMPTVADLVGELPVTKWVYYCVDDFTTWPGLDQQAVRRLEDQLIDQADQIIAVSEPLVERAVARGRTAHLLPHGVDIDFWKVPPPGEPPDELRGLPRPWLVFWGLIDRRMDLDILRELSKRRLGSVVLVGPENDPDPEVGRLPGIVRRPAVALERLPTLAAAADLLIMPYADLPVTRAIQPLKLKEYLATGRPVVARDLPAIRTWADALDLATAEDFADIISRRLRAGPDSTQLIARNRLQSETWAAKAAEMARIVGLPVGLSSNSPEPDSGKS